MLVLQSVHCNSYKFCAIANKKQNTTYFGKYKLGVQAELSKGDRFSALDCYSRVVLTIAACCKSGMLIIEQSI